VENLAEATLPADFPDESLVELSRLAGFSELVYLGTCNRVEFYFAAESRIHKNPLLFHLRRSLADLTDGACQLPSDDELYIHHGRAAARHLFRVTSAIDSMMVGEAQITGQAKDAHERAHEAGLLGGPLDQMFHEAFRVSKRVRSETDLARRPVSLVTLVERTLHDHMAVSTSPILIIGAGEMAQQTLRLIRTGDRERKVLMANRDPARAETVVANDPAAQALPLYAMLASPPEASAVVAATAADETIVKREQISAIRAQLSQAQGLLLIDLAMPPNLDPEAGSLAGVTLHGIEAMREEADRNRQLRIKEVSRCEDLVEHQLQILRRRLFDRALSPAAQSVSHAFQEVADRAIQHALSKELAHLDDDDQRALKRTVNGLVRRLVQVPMRGLKGAAWNHSSAVLDNFIRGIEEGLVPDELLDSEMAEGNQNRE
jgi:glutamyl-tRNA reductase